MKLKNLIIVSLFIFFSFGELFAQSNNTVKLKLIDSLTMAPVEYATVHISKAGNTNSSYYALTNEKGEATIEKVRKGSYTFKAEMMGYVMKCMEIKVEKSMDLGTIKMEPDVTTLDQAVVTALGNPIVVKKDTIEYNAASFKTTDNDVLEDLLKKLPGVEVNSDGTVTANGQTITKITIDGKTFFLDDPQLATKNLPAKIINKVKVIEKKSEQAEFTGIDDGEIENIIDLSIMPGMMRGWFGNMTAGAGLDIANEDHDLRWQGSAMIGRFTDETQLSLIGNANNTNNRGFADMAGSMMGSMRSSTGRGGGMMGGGGPRGGGMFGASGITTSWMGGINANGYLLEDNAMQIGGNYVYNGSEKVTVEGSTRNTTINDTEHLITKNDQQSINNTQGHRAGAEVEWKLSDKTSLMFRPQFNIGYGNFTDQSTFSSINDVRGKVNDGSSLSTGISDSRQASGRLFLRQRLGELKGHTVSLMFNYSLSDNYLNGLNQSETKSYNDGVYNRSSIVDQEYNSVSKNYSLSGRLSYTVPLGRNFFFEAAYRYGYSQRNSEKLTYDKDLLGDYNKLDKTYSNRIQNRFINQNGQVNIMKQEAKYSAQVGFSVQPSSTRSVTHLFNEGRDSTLAYSVLNFSPSARFEYKFSDNKVIRLNYRGSTDQPSINQLQPVADNSNPLYISLGNPLLQPQFTHSVRADYRSTNKEVFSSFNAGLELNYIKDDFVTASWYDLAGVQYSAPINANEGTYSGNGRIMFNTPFGKSNFSLMSFTNVGLRSSLNYSGLGDAKTIDEIIDDLLVGRTTTLSLSESLNFVYRGESVEARLGGRASYSTAWYTIEEQQKPDTWTNSINGEVIATLPWGMEIKSDARYTFYIGYGEDYNKPRLVWNGEISQLLFKKKATIRLKVYDILNQAHTIYRTTADNYIQDVKQNTLGQYAMLSFSYRFGNFGDAAKNMRRGGRGGMRGPGGMGGRRF